MPESADTPPKEKRGDAQAGDEARPIERTIAAKQAPTKTVNNSDDGIEAVEQAPLLRHDGAGEANGRDIEAELQQEGNDVAEIAIFDVQRGDPEGWANAGQERQQDENRQEQNP